MNNRGGLSWLNSSQKKDKGPNIASSRQHCPQDDVPLVVCSEPWNKLSSAPPCPPHSKSPRSVVHSSACSRLTNTQHKQPLSLVAGADCTHQSPQPLLSTIREPVGSPRPPKGCVPKAANKRCACGKKHKKDVVQRRGCRACNLMVRGDGANSRATVRAQCPQEAKSTAQWETDSAPPGQHAHVQRGKVRQRRTNIVESPLTSDSAEINASSHVGDDSARQRGHSGGRHGHSSSVSQTRR